MITLKNVKFRDIQKYAGYVCIQTYEIRGEKKDLAFTPVAEPVESDIKCSNCGIGAWNATNFCNTIHFCPNRELADVMITDYKAKKD